MVNRYQKELALEFVNTRMMIAIHRGREKYLVIIES
jgi:hypothetical protein